MQTDGGDTGHYRLTLEPRPRCHSRWRAPARMRSGACSAPPAMTDAASGRRHFRPAADAGSRRGCGAGDAAPRRVGRRSRLAQSPGTSYYYAHLDRVAVRDQQRVKAGMCWATSVYRQCAQCAVASALRCCIEGVETAMDTVTGLVERRFTGRLNGDDHRARRRRLNHRRASRGACAQARRQRRLNFSGSAVDADTARPHCLLLPSRPEDCRCYKFDATIAHAPHFILVIGLSVFLWEMPPGDEYESKISATTERSSRHHTVRHALRPNEFCITALVSDTGGAEVEANHAGSSVAAFRAVVKGRRKHCRTWPEGSVAIRYVEEHDERSAAGSHAR